MFVSYISLLRIEHIRAFASIHGEAGMYSGNVGILNYFAKVDDINICSIWKKEYFT